MSNSIARVQRLLPIRFSGEVSNDAFGATAGMEARELPAGSNPTVILAAIGCSAP
jgi:hypothetical protein